MFAQQLTTAGRTELIFIIFMMVFLFVFGCVAVYFFVRQYRREKPGTPPVGGGESGRVSVDDPSKQNGEVNEPKQPEA